MGGWTTGGGDKRVEVLDGSQNYVAKQQTRLHGDATKKQIKSGSGTGDLIKGKVQTKWECCYRRKLKTPYKMIKGEETL